MASLLHDKFMRNVPEDTGHQLWLGSTVRGYGRFILRRGCSVAAHWVVYHQRSSGLVLVDPWGARAAAAEAVSNGLELDHLCRTKRCVRYECLELVTHAENVRRGTQQWKDCCPNGHEINDKNTRIRYHKGGTFQRVCRVCQHEYMKAYRNGKESSGVAGR